VKFSNSDKNLLPEPVIVANVLITPGVIDSDDYLFMSDSNELRVNGTGFIGAKKVDLYFQPPLVKQVAYEDVSNYPLVKNEVILRLGYDYPWRKAPGALYVIGVDTGGGPVKVGGDVGWFPSPLVLDGYGGANGWMDLPGSGVHVAEVLEDVQVIYDKSPKLRLKGSGFDANDHDIILELGAQNQPTLRVDKDYLITKDADGDGLILKLLGNRK
jgi:hypothetical protein